MVCSHLDSALADRLSADHLLERVEQEILSPRLGLDLVEDEGEILGEVAQGDVSQRVARS